MKNRNLRLISVMSVILSSAPAFGQVVHGGATGSIGGSVSGTLQRPSAIDRMHTERDRIEQTSVSATGKARESAEVTAGRATDRAANRKERVSEGASNVAGRASASASGALSVTESTTTDSVHSAAQLAGSAAAKAEGSASSNEPEENAHAPVVERDPTTVALGTDSSGGGAANVTTHSGRADSSAEANAAARRDGATFSGDASASGEANANINNAN